MKRFPDAVAEYYISSDNILGYCEIGSAIYGVQMIKGVSTIESVKVFYDKIIDYNELYTPLNYFDPIKWIIICKECEIELPAIFEDMIDEMVHNEDYCDFIMDQFENYFRSDLSVAKTEVHSRVFEVFQYIYNTVVDRLNRIMKIVNENYNKYKIANISDAKFEDKPCDKKGEDSSC